LKINLLSDRNLRNIAYAFITAGVFIVYLITMAPGVIQIDSGELATVQSLPGIAHPSGYPLFTIIGYIFSLIPMGISKIQQLNLLSVIFSTASLLMFFRITLLILDNTGAFINLPKRKKPKSKKELKTGKGKKEIIASASLVMTGLVITETGKLVFALGGSLLLAFSTTFWFQSVSVEVYSLHIFLLTLILYTLLVAFLNSGNNNNSWYLLAVTLALGFSNHLTTLLILPAIAYLYFSKLKFNKMSLSLLAKMIGLFLAVLALIYSYFPIIAGTNPPLNWGNPVDLESILRHISGKQYQVWMFSSFESAKKQLGYFVTNLPKEFAVSLLFIAAGIVWTFIKMRKLFYLVLILFISTLFYSINYDIVDIDSYFLLAFIALAMWGVWGIYYFYTAAAKDNNTRLVMAGIVALIIFIQAFLNFPRVNQSGNYIFEDYSKAALSSVEKNSVIFSYQWDYLISPGYYFQFVENYRKDVAVIDKELLRRSWYYNQIRRNYPEVTSGISNLETEFLRALKPFERDEEFNSNLLESLYRQVMTQLVSSNFPKRNYYIGAELVLNEMSKGEFTLPQGLKLIPHLFFFKVTNDDSYQAAGDFNYVLRKTEIKNNYTAFIKDMIPNMLIRRSMYEMEFNKLDRAKHYLTAIKKNFPGYKIPANLVTVLDREY